MGILMAIVAGLVGSAIYNIMIAPVDAQLRVDGNRRRKNMNYKG